MKRLYRFIQTPLFSRLLDETGEEGFLEAIEDEIIRNPEGGSLIKGGMRKLRVAPPRRASGKSGGYRVWFYHDVPNDVYLLFLLDKRVAGDLTHKQEMVLDLELKKALKRDDK